MSMHDFATKSNAAGNLRHVGADRARALLAHHAPAGEIDIRTLAPQQQDLLRRVSDSGQRLDSLTRAEMELRLGDDFSQVRVHHDDDAAAAAESVNALAYTNGVDIVFGQRQYAPFSSSGRGLIAHELAHIVERRARYGAASTVIHRQPRPRSQQTREEGGTVRWQGWSYFKVESLGVTVRVGVETKHEAAARAQCNEIAVAISASNAAIAEPAMKVSLGVLIDRLGFPPAPAEFRLYQERPILILPFPTSAGAVTHEMGHAIFDALTHESAKVRRAKPTELTLRVADIFLRLQQTAKETRQLPGQTDPTSAGVGLWIFDPTSWARGTARMEHPMGDADEFFASAWRAVRTDLPGVRRAIRRAELVDPSVGAPANEMLQLLAAVQARRRVTGTLADDRRSEAVTELSGIGSPDVEGNLAVYSNLGAPDHYLEYALDPGRIPGRSANEGAGSTDAP